MTTMQKMIREMSSTGGIELSAGLRSVKEGSSEENKPVQRKQQGKGELLPAAALVQAILAMKKLLEERFYSSRDRQQEDFPARKQLEKIILHRQNGSSIMIAPGKQAAFLKVRGYTMSTLWVNWP